MGLEYLFENADVVAIAKPPGLSSIAERDPAAPSAHRQAEAERGERLFIVHRLDKEVSGLLLFARNPAAHRALSLAFQHREAKKTYLALLTGAPAAESGVIDLPIAEFGSGRMGVRDSGKPSRSEWIVRQRRGATTLVEAHPITGRRHQLRVHFYAIGHPIAGDPRYGDHAAQAAFPRLMLHAWRLSVGDLRLEAAPPDILTP